MNKIKSISRNFRILFKLAVFLVPIMNCVVWVFYDKFPQEVTVTLLPHFLNLTQININPTTKTLACIACMLQVAVILYALKQLLKLFKNYEQGEIFSFVNVTYYKKLGYSVFAWVITDKIVDVLISIILTYQNAVGQRQIAVRLGSADLIALAVGGLIILIAWIMNEGHKLNEEQALTI
jgi:hypothetical protein